MRLYRVSYYETGDGHRGYAFYETRAEADAAAREWLRDYHDDEGARATVDTIYVPTTKHGFLQALVKYASHPDNG